MIDWNGVNESSLIFGLLLVPYIIVVFRAVLNNEKHNQKGVNHE